MNESDVLFVFASWKKHFPKCSFPCLRVLKPERSMPSHWNTVSNGMFLSVLFGSMNVFPPVVLVVCLTASVL